MPQGESGMFNGWDELDSRGTEGASLASGQCQMRTSPRKWQRLKPDFEGLAKDSGLEGKESKAERRSGEVQYRVSWTSSKQLP